MVVDATPGTGSSFVFARFAAAFHGAVWFPSAGHLWVTPDIVPPAVTAATFDPGAQPSVRLQFDQDVGQSLSAGDFDLVNRSISTAVAAAAATLQVDYDPTTLLATVTVTTADGQPLADGDYRLTLRAGSVTDAAGNPLAADFTFDFFVLAGDASRDRAVDFNDLVVLAQNYNTIGNKLWSDGDFTGDGNVDFNDLVILAQRYNTTLPAPVTAPVPAATTVKPKAAKPVFSVTPVAKPAPKTKMTPRRR
jgi:hypothetical protein